MSPRTLSLLSAYLFLSSTVSATCYWPTGNATYDRDAYEHQPCSTDPTNPMSNICCALNRTNPTGGKKDDGRTADECLPNGICRNRVLNRGTMEVSYWRESCTQQDWKKGLCLDICADVWTAGNLTEGSIMTPCDGTAESLKWCCGFDTSCCKDDSKVKILAFEFGGAIPNTSKAATPTPTPVVSATPTADAKEKKDDGDEELSTGAKAGIGIGAAIGALALFGLGFFIAKNRNRKPAPDYEIAPPPPPPEKYYRYEAPENTMFQLDSVEGTPRDQVEGRAELHSGESLATFVPGGGFNKSPQWNVAADTNRT